MSGPTPYDMACGAKVMVGDHNWRKGPFWPAIFAWAFGKRERFEHLGMRCTVSWWKGKPYLTGLEEA